MEQILSNKLRSRFMRNSDYNNFRQRNVDISILNRKIIVKC